MSTESEKTELGSEDEQFADNQMFIKLMKLPHALILQQNEEMRKEIAETVESTKLTVRERKKLENVVAEMTVEASKTRTRRRKAVKEVKQYCRKLEDAQALYNSLVEPFNECEIVRRANAKKLSEVSNKLLVHQTVFDEMREKHDQTITKLNNTLAEKKVEVEIRRNKLIDLNDKLEQRKISMKLKLEKRDKSKNELQMLKVEDQMKELNFYRSKLAETKRSLKEIETVCNENDLKINTKSQEVHDLQIHLKSIEKEKEEENIRVDELEQRIKHDKTLVLQHIQTTLKQEWVKVDQANLNIAGEMNLLMKKKDDSEILMQLLTEKKQSLVEDRQNVVQEQSRILIEVEEQKRKVAAVPIINPAFEIHIEELNKKIKDSKERKLKQAEIYHETRRNYENTLKGIIKQQDLIQGIEYEEDKVNISSSSKSFSQSSDIQQIEKIDVTAMANATMSSFSPCTTASKLNKNQHKSKKTRTYKK